MICNPTERECSIISGKCIIVRWDNSVRWDYPHTQDLRCMHSCPFGMGSHEFSKFCMNEDLARVHYYDALESDIKFKGLAAKFK